MKRSPILYIIFLGLVAATPPLSTDMYLAAIPRIAEEWSVSKNLIDLSLVLWFLAFSISLLIVGSLSDRWGRRPVLLGGLIGFVFSSFLCSFSKSPEQLIFFRILQGVSAAGASSMTMAICRDRYEGIERKKVLAWMGIILSVMPILAPSIGAVILKYGHWSHIFKLQGMMGLGSLCLTLFVYEETAKERILGSYLQLFSRYKNLLSNRGYMTMTLVMCMIPLPFYTFIAFSATAYIKIFGLSDQSFGIVFGVNAFLSMMGSLLSTRLIHRYSDATLLDYSLWGNLLAGSLLLFFAWKHWLILTLTMGLYSFFIGLTRPVANHVVLEQVNEDIGAASSGIVFYQFLMGALGMAIISYPWAHPFIAFGLICLIVPLFIKFVWGQLITFMEPAEQY